LILTNIVYLLCKLYVVFNYKVHHCFNKLIVYMIKFNFLITIILIAFLSSCDPGADDDYFNRKEPIDTTITSDDLNLKISYYGPLENTIYPSVILGLSNYSARENYSLGLIKYKLTTPKNKCSLKIKLLQSTVNNETVFQEQLDLKGRKNEFFPKINWNYEKLKSLKQQGTVDLSFTCYIDNKEIDNQSLRLSYRSVNECVYGMMDKAYVDFEALYRMQLHKTYFITRAKDTMKYQQLGTWATRHSQHLSQPMANRNVFQIDQGKPDGQIVLGIFRECCQDPSLGCNQFIPVACLDKSSAQKPTYNHGSLQSC
jgi:hypothetical protein